MLLSCCYSLGGLWVRLGPKALGAQSTWLGSQAEAAAPLVPGAPGCSPPRRCVQEFSARAGSQLVCPIGWEPAKHEGHLTPVHFPGLPGP